MIPLSILQYRREQAIDAVDIDMVLLDALGELENAYARINELEASATDRRNGRGLARPRRPRPTLRLVTNAEATAHEAWQIVANGPEAS